MKHFLIVCLLSSCLFSCQNIDDNSEEKEKEPTTFILIRHAEKSQDDPNDPPLSVTGLFRSERLAGLLAPMEIQAIYSTDYKRTISTVLPLSQSKNLSINKFDPRDSSLLVDLMQKHQGQTIVLSGHSNTTPMLANQLLGKDKFESLDENEYDKVFIVVASAMGEGKDHVLSY